MESISDRLMQFIDSQGYSIRFFESEINASHGTVNRFVKGKSDIGIKWIGLIANKFPMLDSNWLITGEGSMLKSGGGNISAVAGRDMTHTQVGYGHKAGGWDKEECDCEAVQALLKERERLLEEKDKYIALQDRMIEVLQKQNP